MSTKIYTAYRTKEGINIFDLLPVWEETALRNIRKVIKEVYFDKRETIIGQNATIEDMDRLLFCLYTCSNAGFKRTAADLDVGLRIYLHEGRYYIIPYCNFPVDKVVNFLSEDSNLKEYAYWNNVDAPEEMDEEEWDERGETWDKILETSYLLFEICSYDKFYKVWNLFDSEKMGIKLDWKDAILSNEDLYNIYKSYIPPIFKEPKPKIERENK